MNTQVTNSSSVFIYGVSWMPDSENLIWAAEEGLFKTNVLNNQTLQLAIGCDSKTFLNPSVSPDGLNIIYEGISRCRIDHYTINVEIGLWIMNVDGSLDYEVEF